MAVRKRVIRTMKEMCEKRPDFDKIPEICAKIIRRVNDEEGIRKLVNDTFHSLWFQQVRTSDSAALLKKVLLLEFVFMRFFVVFEMYKNTCNFCIFKVVTITDVVQVCMRDGSLDCLETVLNNLLKGGDKQTITSSKQLVDCLVENILTLEAKMAGEII